MLQNSIDLSTKEDILYFTQSLHFLTQSRVESVLLPESITNDPQKRQVLEKKIVRLINSCGCISALTALMISFSILPFYIEFDWENEFWMPTTIIVSVALVFASLAKLGSLLVNWFRLRHVLSSLYLQMSKN